MKEFKQQLPLKSWYYSLSITESYTDSKSPKQLRKRVAVLEISELDPCILHSIASKTKDLSLLDGEMNSVKKGAEQEEDITKLLLADQKPSNLSKDSAIISSNGSLSNRNEIKKIIDSICLQSRLAKWAIIPLVYLPLIEKDRREEWLGDYNEDLREIIDIYPKWFVWIIILMQAGIRIVSALKINLQEIIITVLKR